MAKYSYITDKSNSNRKIQVESAKRDGSGKNIENNYAKQNGFYSTLTAGKAEAIASNREIDDAEIACPPITFGIAGDEAEIQTGINNLEYLEGKSIKFNQIADNSWSLYKSENGTITNVGGSEWKLTFGASGMVHSYLMQDSTPAPIVGHKYLALIDIKIVSSTITADPYVLWGRVKGGDFIDTSPKKYVAVDGEWHRVYQFRTQPSYDGNDSRTQVKIYGQSGSFAEGDTLSVKNGMIFDLTEIFGSGNEPTSYEEFKSLFPLDYYEYSAGSILSSKSYQLISRGKNQFPALNEFIPVIGGEEYEISGISAGGVLYQYDANKVLIDTSDTFTDTVDIEMEENTAFVKISATTYEDIMFYLTFPEDGGVYGEPYVAPRVEAIDLPNIELRSVGDVKDVAYSAGGGIRKIGYYVCGADENLAVSATSAHYRFKISGITNAKGVASNTTKANIIASRRFVTKTASEQYADSNGIVGGIAIDANGNVFVTDTTATDHNTATIKALLNGVVIIYELATETDIPLTENPGWTPEIFVDNFGTLEFVTNPAQVPQVEQPYFIRYTVSLTEFLDTAYVKTKGDGNNVATQEEVDEMKAGNVEVGLSRASENLTPYSEDSGAEDTGAFTMQTSGGEADIGSQAYLRALRGKTIKWNQLVSSSPEENSITSSSDTMATYSFTGFKAITGHKYLIKITTKLSAIPETHDVFRIRYYFRGQEAKNLPQSTSYSTTVDFVTATSDSTLELQIRNDGTCYFKDCQAFDLTEIFGEGNEPTTLAEFISVFPKAYYEYNAGELLSAKSNGYKTVGYNAWDEEWEVGGMSANGVNNGSTTNIRSVNYIKVIAGEKYAVHCPQNVYIFEYDADKQPLDNPKTALEMTNSVATITLRDTTQYVRFYTDASYGTTYNHDISISLYWDGSRTGYEPYESETYSLPNVELRSAGSVCDELKPDGTLIRRVGVVDLGSLSWTKYGDTHIFYADISGRKSASQNNLIAKYSFENKTASASDWANLSNKCYVGNIAYATLYIRDDSYNDASAFKTALSGVILYYELATPTEEQTSNTFQEVTDIDDFGTQEFLSEQEIQVPQGAEFFYPADYKAFIDTMYNKVEGDADEFVTQDDLQTALSTFLSSITGYDASKNQTLKHDDTGEMAWVDDE